MGNHPLQYVKKPVYSREGANVSIVVDGKVIEERQAIMVKRDFCINNISH